LDYLDVLMNKVVNILLLISLVCLLPKVYGLPQYNNGNRVIAESTGEGNTYYQNVTTYYINATYNITNQTN